MNRWTWMVLLLLMLVEGAGTGAQRTPDTAGAPATYVKATTPDAGDQFGARMVMDGTTLVVSAPFEASAARGVNGDASDNSAPRAGAVFVFVFTGVTWEPQAYLKASNTDADDQFGSSLALHGDTLVVGSPHESSTARGVDGDQENNESWGSGAVYIFQRTNGIWGQAAYLKAPNSDGQDHFGRSVALDGGTLIVGASGEASAATIVDGDTADNSASGAGAVYVYEATPAGWTFMSYLKAPNAEAGDLFGSAVDLHEDTIVVGAPGEDSAATGVDGDPTDNHQDRAGAAYLFTRTATTWEPTAYLKAPASDSLDWFGRHVAIDDPFVAISTDEEDSAARGVNGDPTDNSAPESGAVYLYEAQGDQWAYTTYLKASNSDENDHFGDSLDLHGNRLVVGAPFESSHATGMNGDQTDNTTFVAGAAYLFTYHQGHWQQDAYIKASNTESLDWGGSSVALTNTMVALGALGEAGGSSGVGGNQGDNSLDGSGAVYVYAIPRSMEVFLPLIAR